MFALIDIETGKTFLAKEINPKSSSGSADLSAIEAELENMSNTIETLNNDLSELGEQVQAIQGDVNQIKQQISGGA